MRTIYLCLFILILNISLLLNGACTVMAESVNEEWSGNPLQSENAEQHGSEAEAQSEDVEQNEGQRQHDTEENELESKIKLKIISINIHTAKNWNGIFDLDSLVEFLKSEDPDIIGMQEVDRNWSKRSMFLDLCTELSSRLNMYHAYSASLERAQGYYGNLILSKYPIVQSRAEKLPSTLETRSFVYGQVYLAGAWINIINTHLGLSEVDRYLQASKIDHFSKGLKGPLIIMGDFNAEASDPGVQILKQNKQDLQEMSEYCSWGTFRAQSGQLTGRIDYILVSNEFEYQSFKIVDNYISDHLPLIAEISLKSEPFSTTGEPVFLNPFSL